jgi:CCR4-NOT transcription complex subunit 6
MALEDDSSTGSGSANGFSGSSSGGANKNLLTPGTQSQNNQNDYGSHPNDSDNFAQGEEWIEISHEQIYIPTSSDVGRKLKLEASAYASDSGDLLMHRVVKTDVVLSSAPDPMKRNLVTAKTSGPRGGERFRIVSYNILAEIYATQQQYPYCDFWALTWEYRFHNIHRELLDACPDIICLQEVQADHYDTHVYSAMIEAGFEGVFKHKTRAAMGFAGKVDGCALFWRRSKFHLVESYTIEFNELAQRQATQVLGMNPRSEECVGYLNRLLKDNIAQLVVLEFVQPSLSSRSNRDPINQVCIANTHLYSNKDFPDVKLWQTWQLLQELETFVLSRGTNLPLMICGDFNSTPDTAVYDLLSRQAVHPGHPDVNVNNGDDSSPSILPDAMSISHSFQLGSVYQTVMGEEPKATNYTYSFKGVLDYMWFSAQNLRPLSAAPIPDEAVLTKHGEALPSTQYSSDHIMLISDMQIMGSARPPP